MAPKTKIRVVRERATTWITVKGSVWKRNGYPVECIDRFDDVWLKPHYHAPNLYATVQGPTLYFSIENECLIEN